jgi:hypothetical protein
MSGERRPRRGTLVWKLAVTLVVVLLAVPVVGSAPGGATQQAADPTVENVTTTVEGGNLTLRVRATDVTEIDVRDVPAAWSVRAHSDDGGVYGDRTDGERVVRWFWAAPFDVTVSVTFALTGERVGTPPALVVVPYAGTIEGNRTEVTPVLSTPTPTATAAPTPTVTATTAPTPTPTGTAATATTPTSTVDGGSTVVEATTTRPVPGEGKRPTTRESTDASGPGFGPVALLTAAVLSGCRVARSVR